MNVYLDTEKKKLAETENEMDADIAEEEEEDMDEDEVKLLIDEISRQTNRILFFFLLYFRLRIILNLILIQVTEMMMISTMKVVMVEIKLFFHICLIKSTVQKWLFVFFHIYFLPDFLIFLLFHVHIY